MKIRLASACLSALLVISAGCALEPEVRRLRYTAGDRQLIIELLDDDLLHFEFSEADEGVSDDPGAIATSPMVTKTDYRGPSVFQVKENGEIRTAEMLLTVDREALRITIHAIGRGAPRRLMAIAQPEPSALTRSLKLSSGALDRAYGLGEQFRNLGNADGDWVGSQRLPGCRYGNKLVDFDGGCVGNAQFPVLFATGPDKANIGLFIDDLVAQRWDLRDQTKPERTWVVTSMLPERATRGYVMMGPDLPDLRRDYMELTGRPPVPPRKLFGLWVSEYGYENWEELEGELQALRKQRFPVDGFVLDLQWFGGIGGEGRSSKMGNVAWDRAQFPAPRQKIEWLREKHGVGLILIEESYVDAALPEHARLDERRSLVRLSKDGAPVRMKTWWGDGGMLDWTDPDTGDFWHDLKRQPLVEDGVFGHWTDLGEPEAFIAEAWYHGFPDLDQHSQADIHNIYNFRWVESIARGYERNRVARRPGILSRSGTSGIQRFGVGMWSGDIGSNLQSLASHLNVQMHMSFSGIDYFGADIGGFNRDQLLGNDAGEMYTKWFALGAAIDVPVRPHTSNLHNLHKTSPARIGDLGSNLANIRRRYQLIPYLYSLAHQAYLNGDPVFPPPVFYHQEDAGFEGIGRQKMIGRDLMTVGATEPGAESSAVSLPKGTWCNFDSFQTLKGGTTHDLKLHSQDGTFLLPMLARAGAIIPCMHVDDQTMNAFGKRLDGTLRDELVLRVFHSTDDLHPAEFGPFKLFEDDGETIAYQRGEVRTTQIQHLIDPGKNECTVVIHAAEGGYAGAPQDRHNVVEYVHGPLWQSAAVLLDGEELKRVDSRDALESTASGWCRVPEGVTVAKTPRMTVGQKKTLRFNLPEVRIADPEEKAPD